MAAASLHAISARLTPSAGRFPGWFPSSVAAPVLPSAECSSFISPLASSVRFCPKASLLTRMSVVFLESI